MQCILGLHPFLKYRNNLNGCFKHFNYLHLVRDDMRFFFTKFEKYTTQTTEVLPLGIHVQYCIHCNNAFRNSLSQIDICWRFWQPLCTLWPPLAVLVINLMYILFVFNRLPACLTSLFCVRVVLCKTLIPHSTSYGIDETWRKNPSYRSRVQWVCPISAFTMWQKCNVHHQRMECNMRHFWSNLWMVFKMR